MMIVEKLGRRVSSTYASTRANITETRTNFPALIRIMRNTLDGVDDQPTRWLVALPHVHTHDFLNFMTTIIPLDRCTILPDMLYCAAYISITVFIETTCRKYPSPRRNAAGFLWH